MSRRSAGGARPIPPRDELIAIGVIRKAHGVHGEASTESLSDSLERFGEIEHAFLVSPDETRIEPVTIESSRVHVGRALVQFKEITSPEALRDYYNWTVEIHQSDARELGEDEYFLHDLVGLDMVAPDGTEIGKVVEVNEAGGGLLLTVKPQGGKPFDVPFVADICSDISLEQKRIVAELPLGLANLDDVEETGQTESTNKRHQTPAKRK